MNFLRCQGFFYINFDFKNGCENEFKDYTGKSSTDPDIEFLTKSIPKPYGCAAAMPTGWELMSFKIVYLFYL